VVANGAVADWAVAGQERTTMIIEHLGKSPRIPETAFVAPTATVCGQVSLGPGACVLHGATVVAEGGHLEIGRNSIVMQNAVVRSTARHSTRIGASCLVGPGAHVVGCTLEEAVFVATGAAVFHGAHLGTRSEVRINGVVHLRTRLQPDTTVPIGWVAVGDPAAVLPPDEHEEIWVRQEPLNFPLAVYGIERAAPGKTNLPEITAALAEMYRRHREDRTLGDSG
jgi:carbonic anhydrase/acetyltransferase-like protein (isoleucine patch superfamily)